MRGLTVDRDGALSIAELEIPRYEEYQALVKVLSCGVCSGTDMKLIHGNFKNMRDYPMVLGHEAIAEVVETGGKVTSLQKGDVVMMPYLYGKSGPYSSGWGAFAEYAVVTDPIAAAEAGYGPGTSGYDESAYAQRTLRLGDRLNAVDAAMLITFREVLAAARRFGFGPDESVVIFGAGPVGLSFTRFARLLGMGTVITFDVLDEKVAEAKRLGADYAFNSRNTDPVAEVRRLVPGGVDYVVDAVGVNELLGMGMRMIKDMGKVCGYGISPNLGMQLDWSGAPYNWSLVFDQFPPKVKEGLAHNQIVAWVESGALNPKDFISDVFDFEHILDAFALVEKRLPGTKKIVIDFQRQ